MLDGARGRHESLRAQRLAQFMEGFGFINARLKEVMVKSFGDVLEMSKKHKIDMRTAAYMVAVHRVAEATLTRGIYP